MSCSFKKTLTESLTKELSFVRVEHTNRRANLDEMTTLLQRMRENAGLPSPQRCRGRTTIWSVPLNVKFKRILQTYEKDEVSFQVESAHLR